MTIAIGIVTGVAITNGWLYIKKGKHPFHLFGCAYALGALTVMIGIVMRG